MRVIIKGVRMKVLSPAKPELGESTQCPNCGGEYGRKLRQRMAVIACEHIFCLECVQFKMDFSKGCLHPECCVVRRAEPGQQQQLQREEQEREMQRRSQLERQNANQAAGDFVEEQVESEVEVETSGGSGEQQQPAGLNSENGDSFVGSSMVAAKMEEEEEPAQPEVAPEANLEMVAPPPDAEQGEEPPESQPQPEDRARNGVKRFHIGKHTCLYCGECFQSKAARGQHYSQKHPNDTRFPCGQCEQRFPTNAKLQTHLRTHTKDRPFKCGDCEKDFGYNSQLKVHFKKEHGKILPTLKRGRKPKVLANPAGDQNPAPVEAVAASTSGGAVIAGGPKKVTSVTPPKKGRSVVKKTPAPPTKKLRKSRTVLKGGVKHLRCPYCTWTVACENRPKLGKHLARKHWNMRPHRCKLCGWPFEKVQYLQKHLESRSCCKQNSEHEENEQTKNFEHFDGGDGFKFNC